MLRQSKPLPRPSGPSTAPDLSLLSLDWDGCAHRYPAPEGAGIRRRGSPLAQGFLMAQRDPIVRPTHQSPSSETIGSRGSRGSGGSSSSSSPSSPNTSPREAGMGAWDRPSPVSAPRRGEQDILHNYQHPRPIYEDQSQPERPSRRCPDGQHTSSGIGGSIRKKLGRRVACSRCGEAYEVKQIERKPSLIEGPLRRTPKAGNYV